MAVVERSSARSEGRAATGMACLARIAVLRGVHLSVDELVREHGAGGPDFGVAELIKIADASGLKARALKLKWSRLSTLGQSLPAMVQLNNGSWMVLTDVDSQSQPSTVTLNDPGVIDEDGILLDEHRFTEAWTGEIILVKRRYDPDEDEQPFGFSWLIAQIVQQKRLFRDIGVAAFIMSLFALAPMLLFQVIIGRVLAYHSQATLGIIAGAVVFLVIFDTLFGYLRRYMIMTATARIDSKINLFIFSRVLNIPIDFFELNPKGTILSDLGQVWKIRNFLTGQLFGTFLDMITLVVILPVMFYFSVILTSIVLTMALLICAVILVFMPHIAKLNGQLVAAENARGNMMYETVAGMRTVKSLALNSRQAREWDVRVARSTRARIKLERLTNNAQTLIAPLEKLMYMGTIVIAAYMALNSADAFSVGTLVGFTFLSMRVAAPLVQLSHLFEQLEEAREAVGRVGGVINRPAEVGRTKGGSRARINGLIEFVQVRFKYAGALTNALDELSFTIPQGTICGVMGRSGSGKTTVTRLLQGLDSNFLGQIKLDGIELRQFNLDHLRRSLGVVLQESFLFSGTVRDNIAIGRPDASLEEVVVAARLAGAEEFIEKLPRGFETWLEEGAANLSGGQRQRLAIARALLPNPRVLILDEATSALDAESEAIINANLLRIAKGRTLIVISHRLSALVPANQILVLERGKVHDIGTHHELVDRCEIYSRMWYQQNRHAIDAGNTEYGHGAVA